MIKYLDYVVWTEKWKITKLQELLNEFKQLFELNDEKSKYFIENVMKFQLQINILIEDVDRTFKDILNKW